MIYSNIPQELKTLKQWCVYRSYYDKNKNKYQKIIISPVTSKFAKSNEPDTWTDFETAKRYCERNRYGGLVFALGGGITFIDLDHAVDKDTGAVLTTDAQELLQIFSDTYAETSLSGTGIHILVRGTLPADAMKKNDKRGVEMYSRYRFMCMTGNLLSDTTKIKDYSDVLLKVNEEYVGKKAEAIIVRSDCTHTDSELLEKIRDSRIAERFNKLYNGNFDGAVSHSSADFALCSILAWWTQDASQIDRIFRSSGLYRSKWDTKRGSSTYGQITIENALNALKSAYTSRQRVVRLTTGTEM